MDKKKLLRIQDFITPTAIKESKNDCGPLKAELCLYEDFAGAFKGPRLCFANRSFINLRLCTVQNIFWYSTDKTSYTIVRPLIACLRSRVTMTCLASLLPVYPDLSNLKIRYSRNRIRRQILPAVKFFLNPKAEKALFQFSEFYNKASKKA